MLERLKDRARNPWKTLPGWEYDLLRALPVEKASSLYSGASIRAGVQLLKKWWWWALVGLSIGLAAVSVLLVWVCAAALGVGPLGRLALDVVFHILLGVTVYHPLIRAQQSLVQPYVRTALAGELITFAQEELAPPLRRKKRRPARRSPHGPRHVAPGPVG
jgi:hypothetical protein